MEKGHVSPPVNPDGEKYFPPILNSRKSTSLTRGTITIIAGSETRDFPPTEMAEGYFPPPYGMAGRYVSFSPYFVMSVLTITFGQSYF
jgi:hypothetical protein